MDNLFDPTDTPTPGPAAPDATLSPDDPLRAWAQHLQDDPTWLNRFVTDHKAAVQELIDKGIPPPPPQAMSFIGDQYNVKDQQPFGLQAGKDPLVGQPLPGRPNERILSIERGPTTGGPMPAAGAKPAPASEDTSALDPEENPNPVAADAVPLPQARPPEAGPSAADRKSKASLSEGLDDFSKSLAGVKPVPPPALNAVGTPGVRSPTAVQAPNVMQLLQLMGQAPALGQLGTLGRLLVAGKA